MLEISESLCISGFTDQGSTMRHFWANMPSIWLDNSMLLAAMRVSHTLESSVAENLEICENSEMRDFESWRVVMGISLLMCSQLILFQYHVLRT